MSIKLYLGIGFIAAAIGWILFITNRIPSLELPCESQPEVDIQWLIVGVYVSRWVYQEREVLVFIIILPDAHSVKRIFQEIS